MVTEAITRAVCIALGLTVAVGTGIVGLLLVLLLRQCRKERTSEKKVENGATSTKRNKLNLGSWIVRKFRGESTKKDKRNGQKSISTPAEKRHHAISSTFAPFQCIVGISSTPFESQKHKIDRNVILDINAFKFNHTVQSVEIQANPPAPDILYESTGYVMSPICHNQTSNNQDDTQSVQLTRNDTTNNGMSNCYNTFDILEGLDKNETTYNGISNCYYTQDILEVFSEHASAAGCTTGTSARYSIKSDETTASLGRLFRDRINSCENIYKMENTAEKSLVNKTERPNQLSDVCSVNFERSTSGHHVSITPQPRRGYLGARQLKRLFSLPRKFACLQAGDSSIPPSPYSSSFYKVKDKRDFIKANDSQVSNSSAEYQIASIHTDDRNDDGKTDTYVVDYTDDERDAELSDSCYDTSTSCMLDTTATIFTVISETGTTPVKQIHIDHLDISIDC